MSEPLIEITAETTADEVRERYEHELSRLRRTTLWLLTLIAVLALTTCAGTLFVAMDMRNTERRVARQVQSALVAADCERLGTLNSLTHEILAAIYATQNLPAPAPARPPLAEECVNE